MTRGVSAVGSFWFWGVRIRVPFGPLGREAEEPLGCLEEEEDIEEEYGEEDEDFDSDTTDHPPEDTGVDEDRAVLIRDYGTAYHQGMDARMTTSSYNAR